MRPYKFILSGGGTGGHIYPAVAIANELKFRYPDAEILFVGAKDKMEMQKVPKAGYEIKGLWISGLQRKLTFDNLMFPLKLLKSMWDSYFIIKKFQPNVVIGTGGFASGPLLKVASLMHLPTIIQEQNSFPGITNKWLSKSAKSICVAYDGMEQFFPKEKVVLSGNPVRQDLLDVYQKQADATEYFALDSTKKTLLVLGGSLGARRINQLIASHAEWLRSKNLQIIWQCGSLYFETYVEFNQKPCTKVFAFIDRMDLAYAAADIIISRAGASSVSELALVGKPVIFIPSPNVAEDHQTKNANALVNKKAALMIAEKKLEAEFKNVLEDLLGNEDKQLKLGKKIYNLAKPNATKTIVEEIEKWLPQEMIK